MRFVVAVAALLALSGCVATEGVAVGVGVSGGYHHPPRYGHWHHPPPPYYGRPYYGPRYWGPPPYRHRYGHRHW